MAKQLEPRIQGMIEDIHHCRFTKDYARQYGGKWYCTYHFPEQLNPPVLCSNVTQELVYVAKGTGQNQIKIPYYRCNRW